jgi:hypothetical protein
MATMKSDHYWGARRVAALLEQLDQFESNVSRRDNLEDVMTTRFALLDAARHHAEALVGELGAA